MGVHASARAGELIPADEERLFMNDREPFPLVLLGAGASAPAGVPTAVEMTRAMMKICREEDQPDYLRALKAITGALQMGLDQAEIPIASDPDVERVLNAALLLGDRSALEFSPFVGAWHPILEDLERQQLTTGGASIIADQAVRRFWPGSLSQDAIKTAIRSTLSGAMKTLADHMSQRPDGALFRDLAAYLTARLIKLTFLKSADGLGYLDPLLNVGVDGAVTIATLNYH
jgi:hypothetical protein